MSEDFYKVLYRKWRPKTFDEVSDQKNVTDILKSQVVTSHIPHALMFCGVRGTGKTSCAKIFAKAINCLNNNDGNPCLKCENCKKIENKSVIDVYEIDAASNNGVENIRTIREESNFVSSELKFKVYIVDEFHMLSSGAFNAFLRTLEEPQKNVVFILATTEFNKIPKTIVSRCQKFDFRRISNEAIFERLKFISKEENIDIDDKSLNLIAKSSDGAMRDALSILDQCSNYEKIDSKKISEILGISGSQYIRKLIENLTSSNLKESVKLVENLFFEGKNLARECENIINFFHEIIFFHSSGTFLENSFNCKEDIVESSKKIDIDDAIFCFKVLENCYTQMSKAFNQRAEFEIAIIEIFEKLKNKVKSDFSNIEAQKYDKTKSEIDSNENKKNIKKSGIPRLECWKKILESIKNKVSPSLFQMLNGSEAYISENRLFVDTNSFIFGMIKKSYSEISQIVEKISGKTYKICRLESEVSDSGNSGIDWLLERANQFGVNVKLN